MEYYGPYYERVDTRTDYEIKLEDALNDMADLCGELLTELEEARS